jgi:hypothetical protein
MSRRVSTTPIPLWGLKPTSRREIVEIVKFQRLLFPSGIETHSYPLLAIELVTFQPLLLPSGD